MARAQKVKISLILTKDGETLRDLTDWHTYPAKNYTKSYNNFVRTSELGDGVQGKLKLKVEISFQERDLARKLKLQKLWGTLAKFEKDFLLIAGKTSIKVSSYILQQDSPVFTAMLNKGFKESQEKIIYLQDTPEQCLKDYIDFLYKGEVITLNIHEDVSHKRICDLITFGDKYQIKSLLEYLLVELTENPTKGDIFNRLSIIMTNKRLAKFEEKGKSLLSWAKQNLSYNEFFWLARKILF